MRNLICINCGVALLLLLASCKKSNDHPNNSSLDGTWEKRQSYSMIGRVNYNPGNGDKMEFSGNTFKIYWKDSLINSGSYQTIVDGNVATEVGLILPDGLFPQYFAFSDLFVPTHYPASNKIYYHISNDSLYTIQGSFPSDGGSAETYVKIQ